MWNYVPGPRQDNCNYIIKPRWTLLRHWQKQIAQLHGSDPTTRLIWIRSVPNRSCCQLPPFSPDYSLIYLVLWLVKVWMCTKMSLSDSNLCTTFLDSQHSHSRLVDHACDAMIANVPEPTRSVLGGGSLLHRTQLQHGTRLWQISEIVCQFHHPPLWFSNYGCRWWLRRRVTH